MAHLSADAAAPLTSAELAMLAPERDGTCIVPVPPEAGLPTMRLPGRGHANHCYEYRGAGGELLGCVLRWNATPRAAKEIRPCTYWTNGAVKGGWQLRTWPTPRPLFGLDRLAKRPDAIVLLVEGEKAAEAVETGPLAEAFKWAQRDVIGVTWPGGGKAIAHADFGPLRNRDLVLLPDHDIAGEQAADALRRRCTTFARGGFVAGNRRRRRAQSTTSQIPCLMASRRRASSSRFLPRP